MMDLASHTGTDPTLFLHALARFRSSQPLASVEDWNNRHAFDLAVALRQTLFLISGAASELAILWLGDGPTRLAQHICLSVGDELIDIFGSHAQARVQDGLFDSPASLTVDRYSQLDKLVVSLDEASYFLEAWPANPDLMEAIQEGVLMAAKELDPSRSNEALLF